MHRPATNRQPTSKKFEDQKKFKFIFEITYDIKYRVFKIMLNINILIAYGNTVVCLFVFSFFLIFKEGFNENIVIKE